MFSAAEFERFDALRAACGDLRYGADAYAYGLVALGTVGVVAEASMNPWDFMALIPVIEGAGGRVTDWAGAPLVRVTAPCWRRPRCTRPRCIF